MNLVFSLFSNEAFIVSLSTIVCAFIAILRRRKSILIHVFSRRNSLVFLLGMFTKTNKNNISTSIDLTELKWFVCLFFVSLCVCFSGVIHCHVNCVVLLISVVLLSVQAKTPMKMQAIQ